MCGLNGFNFDNRALLKKMSDTLRYRGPDSTGSFSDSRVSLGHNRLKILDLSDAGRQPICNEDGTMWLVFNGEIYNHKILRQKLEKTGHMFRSETDTEVIVHAYEQWGIDCVKMLEGMFAFCVYDSEKRMLFLARDRLGIKPLYYYHEDGRFIFSSEMKGLLQFPHDWKLDEKSLYHTVTCLYAIGRRTMVDGISEVFPGTYMIYDLDKDMLCQNRYWKLGTEIIDRTEAEHVSNIQQLMKESVQSMKMCDVPIGVSLSGGLDSSIITQQLSETADDLKTYTIGFSEDDIDVRHARIVAEHCNTDHHEIIADFGNLSKSLMDIIWYADNPIVRTSTFPMYFLGKELGKKVKVLLVGEGADELFGGYPRYKRDEIGLSFFKNNSHNIAFAGLRDDANTVIDHFNKYNRYDLNDKLRYDIDNSLHKIHLSRVDRMTMAHSIEARVPYLSTALVEYVNSMPPHLKIKDSNEKYILKQAFRDGLPAEAIGRKKYGFQTPIDKWFESEFFELLPHIMTKENLKALRIDSTQMSKYIHRNHALKLVDTATPSFIKRKIKNKFDIELNKAYLGKIWFLSMLILWNHRILLNEKNIIWK